MGDPFVQFIPTNGQFTAGASAMVTLDFTMGKKATMKTPTFNSFVYEGPARCEGPMGEATGTRSVVRGGAGCPPRHTTQPDRKSQAVAKDGWLKEGKGRGKGDIPRLFGSTRVNNASNRRRRIVSCRLRPPGMRSDELGLPIGGLLIIDC